MQNLFLNFILCLTLVLSATLFTKGPDSSLSLLTSVDAIAGISIMLLWWSIPFEPEELLPAGERVRVRTHHRGDVGEGAGVGTYLGDHDPPNPVETFHLRYPSNLN